MFGILVEYTYLCIMGNGMTTVEWALRNGYIDDEQYRQYMLQETEYPLPKMKYRSKYMKDWKALQNKLELWEEI